ncbi:MAG TPA: hypothetical protein VL493_01480 [Candidatus Saccharimonadales bacterium]|nr:hypothetical protein [Candidatus Saccharimonadales bacterium]
MKQPKRSPLVSSVNAIRALAAGVTMLSLAGMTIYAGDHLHNQSAPLQPAAAAATAAPARTTTTSTTGRLRLTTGVSTTTTRAVTTTHHS